MFNDHASATPISPFMLRAVTEDGSTNCPREFSLHPASPNPFRLDTTDVSQAGTTFHCEVPERAALSVTICNPIGQRVRLLTATLVESGRYAAHWDGLNDMGIPLASGVYLIKIEAAGESGQAYLATQNVTMIR